jgi:hypothetical protein
MARKRAPFKDPDESKLREDTAETAYRVLQEAIGERPKTVPGQPGEKNPRAQKRGAKGGRKGGPARANKLTKERRSEIGRDGARKRWGDRADRLPDE